MTSNNDKRQDVFKESTTDSNQHAAQTTSTGLDENIAGLLTYVFSPISALILLLIEKESKFVKFHAIQAIIFSIAYFVLSIILGFIPLLGLLITILSFPVYLVLVVILAYKAYKHEMFKLPVIGDIAEKQL